uniref:Uncharacterized protein n=1 Tax=Picea glauca TaxID=3330 RepID=A0A101LZ88_PICGL|nr:hypothetical protein ABT39_MTgene5082 [Picea glauca]
MNGCKPMQTPMEPDLCSSTWSTRTIQSQLNLLSLGLSDA